ncbi:MAG: DUF1566 domain-containing protein [Dyella sp.]
MSHITINSSAARYEISEDGTTVTDHATGLMWARDELPRQDYASAEKAVSDLCLGGYSDWRLPERAELLTIVDLDRHEPAIDTAVFKSAGDWTWTRTPCAWPSGHVWLVYFGDGGVNDLRRYHGALARAVRAAPAGQ